MIIPNVTRVKFNGLASKFTTPGVELVLRGDTLHIMSDSQPFQDLKVNKALGRHTFTTSSTNQPITCRCGISFKYPAEYSEHLHKVLSRV